MNAHTDIMAAMRSDAEICNARMRKVNGCQPVAAERNAGNVDRRTRARIHMLRTLSRGPKTQQALAVAMCRTVPTVSVMSGVLRDLGLVEFQRGYNIKIIRITPAGSAWLEAHGGEA